MSLPILILRPEDGALETRKRVEALGLKAVVDPLFEVRPIDWQVPPANDFDAIMLTSANAVRYAGDGLEIFTSLPAYVVGEATAAAARNAGMQVVHIGNKGAQKLANDMAHRKVTKALRLVGRNYTPVETDIILENRTVYETIPRPMGKRAKVALSQGCVVLLHSTRAATILCSQVDQLNIDRVNIQLVAISQSTAKAAGLGWKSINVAEKPTDDALLSAASALCRA